jgi:hypothetical protein
MQPQACTLALQAFGFSEVAVGKVKRQEMGAALFSSWEAFEGGSWAVAADYEVGNDGKILPVAKPGVVRATRTVPLADPSAFLSFARLSARGRPSEERVLAWVREHGLLRRRDPERGVYLPDGSPNQVPTSVEDLREKSGDAYYLLHLYELYRGGDAGALRVRMGLERRHPEHLREPDPVMDPNAAILLDGQPTGYEDRVARQDGSLKGLGDVPDEIILDAALEVVRRKVNPRIADVQLGFGTDGKLGHRCQDLLSAMWYSFASLVDGKRQSAVCDGCGELFEMRRRRRSGSGAYCGATCRSRAWRARQPPG